MNIIMELFGVPLGWIMHYLYQWIPNYGIALFVFTLFTRLILIPVAIKQQKSQIKLAIIQPKINKLQEKYGQDRARLQEEMQNLYAEEGYSSMSGCLPLLVQFPILFGLIDVIYHPLKHMLRLPKEIIDNAARIYTLLGFVAPNGNQSMLELDIISKTRKYPVFFSALGAAALQSIHTIDYNFIGINLIERPEWKMIPEIFKGQFNPVILIPFISGITSFFMSMLTTRQTSAAGEQKDQTAGMMKGMMLTMPLMSLWIAFTVPAGVGLYWIYSNVLGALQNLVLHKVYNPKEIRAKMEKESEERREKARQERLEAKRKLKAGLLDDEHANKAMTQKELDRAKLAAARKRDAEKYGETEEAVPVADDEDVGDTNTEDVTE